MGQGYPDIRQELISTISQDARQARYGEPSPVTLSPFWALTGVAKCDARLLEWSLLEEGFTCRRDGGAAYWEEGFSALSQGQSVRTRR